MRKLSDRSLLVSAVLRSQKTSTVSQIAGTIHIALIAVFMLLMGWADWRLAMRFVTGFWAAGAQEITGLYPRRPAEEPEWTRSEFLAANAVMRRGLAAWPLMARATRARLLRTARTILERSSLRRAGRATAVCPPCAHPPRA